MAKRKDLEFKGLGHKDNWCSLSNRSETTRFLIAHYSFIIIQPWRPDLTGTRAQSCDRYGSGTLHPGQVLGGSLPLLSPAFRRSHFSCQVPPSATTREILAAKDGTVGEKCLVVILPKFRLPRKFRDLLHAANLRHGTDGFTSPPKEGVLSIFRPNNPTASAGFEPANFCTKCLHATPRPSKPPVHYISHN